MPEVLSRLQKRHLGRDRVVAPGLSQSTPGIAVFGNYAYLERTNLRKIAYYFINTRVLHKN
jgi:hypothetical protein